MYRKSRSANKIKHDSIGKIICNTVILHTQQSSSTRFEHVAVAGDLYLNRVSVMSNVMLQHVGQAISVSPHDSLGCHLLE